MLAKDVILNSRRREIPLNIIEPLKECHEGIRLQVRTFTGGYSNPSVSNYDAAELRLVGLSLSCAAILVDRIEDEVPRTIFYVD